jgi:site-specific DNA-cytosine methylase
VRVPGGCTARLTVQQCERLVSVIMQSKDHVVRQETELLVAGIPCIDVSSAGHRKGAAGLVR